MSEMTPSVMMSSTEYWEPSCTAAAFLGQGGGKRSVCWDSGRAVPPKRTLNTGGTALWWGGPFRVRAPPKVNPWEETRPPAFLRARGRKEAPCERQGGLSSDPGSPGHVRDHGGEVGGAVELHRAQAVVVGLQDAIDATTRGVLLVAVLGAQGAGG